jgi:hypothetical protein
MADKKISALTGASTPLAGTEVLPIVQGGATVKVSAADVTAGRAVSGASFAVTGTTMPANGLYLASANNVSISANSKDYVYVASNGLVRVGDYGAGSAAPAYALTINNKDNYPVAGFLTGATYRGSLGYTFDTGYFGLEAAGRLAFHSSSVYAGEFDTAGNFKAAIGNVVIGTAGKGIDFSANSHAAGMTSELLNDYEEGTLTAAVSCGTSGTISLYSVYDTLTYTRIGRQVTVVGQIKVESVSSPVGHFTVNLPFAIGNFGDTAGSISAGVTMQNVVSANVSDFVAIGDEADTFIKVYLGDGTNLQSDSAQQVQTNTDIFLNITYFV